MAKVGVSIHEDQITTTPRFDPSKVGAEKIKVSKGSNVSFDITNDDDETQSFTITYSAPANSSIVVSPGRGSMWTLRNGTDATSVNLVYEGGKTSEVVEYTSDGFDESGDRKKTQFKVKNTTSSSVSLMFVQEVAAGSVAKIGIEASSKEGDEIPLSFSLPDSDPEFTIVTKKEKGS